MKGFEHRTAVLRTRASIHGAPALTTTPRNALIQTFSRQKSLLNLSEKMEDSGDSKSIFIQAQINYFVLFAYLHCLLT